MVAISGKWFGHPVFTTTENVARIGVGAGKFLGVRKIFSRITPILPEKVLRHFSCDFHMIFLSFFQKNALWTPILLEFLWSLLRFSQIFRRFPQILSKF